MARRTKPKTIHPSHWSAPALGTGYGANWELAGPATSTHLRLPLAVTPGSCQLSCSVGRTRISLTAMRRGLVTM
jgi:hypothetical protein